MIRLGKGKGWHHHPTVVFLLLAAAGGLWFWNLRSLFQQRTGGVVAVTEDWTLPEVAEINHAFAQLPELERDPFMAAPPKRPNSPAVATQPQEPVADQPMPPIPPQGQLQMVLKRQSGFAAIFKFGRKEPEVLVVGDVHSQWKVVAITLNQVTWHHEPTESDYVSQIP